MSDVVVTVPKNFRLEDEPSLRGLAAWVAEGDLPGEEYSGIEWEFNLGGTPPSINPGERVYVVCEGKLRGYAPLLFIQEHYRGAYSLIRGGDAVAVTIPERIVGFRGFRYRWWDRAAEVPFPDWTTP